MPAHGRVAAKRPGLEPLEPLEPLGGANKSIATPSASVQATELKTRPRRRLASEDGHGLILATLDALRCSIRTSPRSHARPGWRQRYRATEISIVLALHPTRAFGDALACRYGDSRPTHHYFPGHRVSSFSHLGAARLAEIHRTATIRLSAPRPTPNHASDALHIPPPVPIANPQSTTSTRYTPQTSGTWASPAFAVSRGHALIDCPHGVGGGSRKSLRSTVSSALRMTSCSLPAVLGSTLQGSVRLICTYTEPGRPLSSKILTDFIFVGLCV
ncbi:hypothetical protein BS50DRAFT_239511 [Corynespora cassiicola Philippines]|uniref:Uncharacterized protein n=1 Tax=Corynespora cassiicola Philippines TaxID=1448308 RepID=A0A2T2P2M9_CORCC|nr:hypothetical protein BS50DRAFT_239511 [Corynespora cassiicola Philippines]